MNKKFNVVIWMVLLVLLTSILVIAPEDPATPTDTTVPVVEEDAKLNDFDQQTFNALMDDNPALAEALMVENIETINADNQDCPPPRVN